MGNYYAMLMAGGGGTRLWPMSRQDKPKQLLPLVEEDSMFKVSVKRLAPLFTPDRIYVVTSRKYVDALRKDAPEIPAENFVIEPYGKDNGPAAGLGIVTIFKRDPQATIAYLTTDHHITQKETFRDVLSAACELAQQGKIVTLGISPSYPATEFGYIRQGAVLPTVGNFTPYETLGFTEKPNVVTASTFLASGEYSWNSGMFIWRAEQALAEFKRQQPEMYADLMKIYEAVDTPDYEVRLEEIWSSIKKISIDYAIMEGAENLAVIPVDIGWNDIGSWSALFDVLKLDKFGNHFKGSKASDKVILDTTNTLVYSEKLTVTVGVDDLIVIETPDALLICHKDRAQDVKEVVNHLLTTKNYKYL
jgi:mannose-1-phosphate guanylyltransferase